MNETVNDRLEGIRRALTAQSAAGSGLPSTAKGGEREAFVGEFLARVFPPHFRFGTGFITDSKGAKSGQIELVAELPFFPSIPIPPADVRMYFAEGVALAIEIKSDLSSQWHQVEDTVRSVRVLSRQIPEGTMWFGDDPPSLIPVFVVGYRGFSTVKGVESRIQNTAVETRPDATLLLGDPGVFVCGEVTAIGGAAMMGFLGRVAHLCSSLIYSRFNPTPYVQ